MMKECVIPIKQESKDFEGLNSPPVPKRNINKGNMEKNQFTDVEGRFIECWFLKFIILQYVLLP